MSPVLRNCVSGIFPTSIDSVVPPPITDLKFHVTLHYQYVHCLYIVDISVFLEFLTQFRSNLGHWHVQGVHLLDFRTLVFPSSASCPLKTLPLLWEPTARSHSRYDLITLRFASLQLMAASWSSASFSAESLTATYRYVSSAPGMSD